MGKMVLNNRGLRKMVPYLEEKYPSLKDQLIIVDDHLRLASDPEVEIMVRVPISELAPNVPIRKDSVAGTASTVTPTDPRNSAKPQTQIKTELPLGAQTKTAVAQQSATAAPAEIKQNTPPQAAIVSKGAGGTTPAAELGRAGQTAKMRAEKEAMAAAVQAQKGTDDPTAVRLQRQLPPAVQKQGQEDTKKKETEIRKGFEKLAPILAPGMQQNTMKQVMARSKMDRVVKDIAKALAQ